MTSAHHQCNTRCGCQGRRTFHEEQLCQLAFASGAICGLDKGIFAWLHVMMGSCCWLVHLCRHYMLHTLHGRRFLHQYLVADTYRPFNEPCPPGFLAFAVLVVGVGFTYPAYLTFQNHVPISTPVAVLCFYLWSTGAIRSCHTAA